jgi:hypothetical protein
LKKQEALAMEISKQSFVGQWILRVIGIGSLLFTFIYGGAGWTVIFLSCVLAAGFETIFKSRENGIFNPYSLMIFSPLLLFNYASIKDFNIRSASFVLFIYILTSAYVFGKQTFFVEPVPPRSGKSIPKSSLGRRRQVFSLLNAGPIRIWLTAFLIFSLVSVVLYFRGIHLSGDEPHYLMIAQSIVDDGDFDLKNNFEEKTYRSYIPVDVEFHGGEIDGRYHSFHLPGVSFLLIPFYLLFKVVGGFIPSALYFRLAASVINAFFALVLFYILRMKFTGKDITGTWLLFLCIFPLAFHSVHLYPELPAAALMAAAYYTVSSARRKIMLTGFFLSLIPWFHIKYIPALAVMAIYIVYDLLKPFRPFSFNGEKVKRLLLFLVFPAISLALLVIYSKTLYNTYSPLNIFPRESYWTVPWGLRLKVLLAYFLDQRDGLLFYAPMFFLAFLGLRKKPADRGLLVWIGFSYILFHAFTTVRGAYSPAGRPLIFVSWIFILFIAHFYYNIMKGPVSRFSFGVLAGLGVFVSAWLFYYPLFMYQPVFSHTADGASGMALFFGSNTVPLWKMFPSFLTSAENGHPANFIWIGSAAAILVLYYLRPLKREEKPLKGMWNEALAFSLFLVISFLYCFYPHVLLLPRNKFTGKSVSFFNNSRNFNYVDSENGFRIKGGGTYDIYIDRNMVTKDILTFHFYHTDVVDVTIRNGKRRLFRSDKSKTGTFTIAVSPLGMLRVGDRNVTHLGFETRTKQADAFLWMQIE